MAAGSERNIGQRVGWTAKVGGLSAAAIGVLGPESLIVPGLVIGAGGWALENVSGSKAKTHTHFAASGEVVDFKAKKRNILERAGDIYLRAGAPKAA
jgi:hypothetical protein